MQGSQAPRRAAMVFWAALGVANWLALPALAQPMTPDEQAAMVLAAGRRAYQEGQLPAAAERFREFLTKFGGHKDVHAARYGLALALVEGPNKDYAAAIDALNHVVASPAFSERPFALYYLGSAHRALGHQALAQAVAKPQEPQHRQTANQRFDQAAPQFAAAATAFAARVKERPAADAAVPLDWEWAARARCDQAEMLVQQAKFAEARAALQPLLDDALLEKSKSRGWALYYYGQACFALKEYQAAGKALSQLAPFDDPALALPARYLLARTHHLADERPEAAAQYEAVLAGYEEQRKTAPQRLQDGEALKNRPAERARLEALARGGVPPDYVARAAFYWAVLCYEEGKFGDAATRFTTFPQQFQQHPLIPEAQFRLGLAQVPMRQHAEALKNLQPYLEHGLWGDQALWWTGRTRIDQADRQNVAAFEQAVRTALDELRRAAEKAGQIAANDPVAKLRRADILLDLGDAQQLVKLHKEAAATYQQVAAENYAPERVPEAWQRQATALHLAGEYDAADEACRRFVHAYPKSSLLPAVLFRYAENAFLASSVSPAPDQPPNRDQEVARLTEAIKRYQVVLDQYPEFAGAQLARQGLGLAYYRLGAYDDAERLLAEIPEGDRTEELATVSYVLADCILRRMPTDSADALAAARVLQDVEAALKLLTAFVGTQPQGPQTPDALLKLGYCYQRTASIVADPAERTAALNNARQSYDKLIQQFANHPLQGHAYFERANCLALAGDANGAANELQRFAGDFSRAPIAPLAVIKLSILWRSQKKGSEAAAMLGQFRAQYEKELLADAARREWAPSLQYHHALALKDAAKPAEARTLFEEIGRHFLGRNEAVEAIWRAGQIRKEEAQAKIDAARKVLENAGAKPEERAAASALREEGIKELRDAARYLQDSAAQIGQRLQGQSGHLQLLYEAAWSHRYVADFEIETARQKLAEAALVKQQAEAAKLLTPEQQAAAEQAAAQAVAGQPAQPAAAMRLPQIALAAIPLQPSEQQAREAYQALIEAAPESPLSFEARLELAEILAQREDHAAAIELLNDAAAAELPAELAERVQLRLGNCWLATENLVEAQGCFDYVARNEKSPLLAEARYRLGEVAVRQQDWPAAIELLLPFRDQGPFHNVPGVSDRALLRLGEALAQAKQWDGSRQAYEALVGRFPNSIWGDDARYGIGWAWQNQSQHDQAIQQYAQVTARTPAEVAARAQVQIGLCRFDQKRFADAAQALLVVPFTYAYPEPSALALCEAARAYLEDKQPEPAQRLLERTIADYPDSPWAEVARTRLAEMKPPPK